MRRNSSLVDNNNDEQQLHIIEKKRKAEDTSTSATTNNNTMDVDDGEKQQYHRHGNKIINDINGISNNNNNNNTGRRIPIFVIKATIIASLGGILFGYDLGVISGALPQLTSTFQLTERQQEVVVSILYVGGGIGAAVGGTICDSFGRRSTIIMTDIWFICGAFILFVSKSIHVVILGRIVVGFAVAVSGIADVSYLHEIAPSEWRGSIVSVNEACISLGFLLAYTAGYFIDIANPTDGWRHMFGISAIIAFIQVIGMYYMPESPIWLKEVGRYQQCQDSLRIINGGSGHDDDNTDTIHLPIDSSINNSNAAATISKSETNGMDNNNNNNITTVATTATTATEKALTTVRSSEHFQKISGRQGSYEALRDDTAIRFDDNNNNNHHHHHLSTLPAEEDWIESSTAAGASDLKQQHHYWWSSFHKIYIVVKRYYRQCCIALFLATTQQLCGQTCVLNYAPLIFASIGSGSGNNSNDDTTTTNNSRQSTLGSALLIGVVKFIVTIFVICRIEFLGRRFLLLSGMSIIAFGMLLLVIAFAGSSSTVQQNANDNSYNDGSEQEKEANNISEEELTTPNDDVAFYLALPGVLFVVCGYSASFGPLTWLLTSELFPTDIRGRALGASTIVTYLVASFVTFTFLSGITMFGSSVVFGLYSLITITSVVWAFLAIPDTGSKDVDQIEDEICTMWFWRKAGSHRMTEMIPVANNDNSIVNDKNNTQRKQQQYSRSIELT